MDGFTAITRIGGYIILFSILIQLMRLLPFRGSLPFQVLLSSLEVTNGAALTGNLPLSFPARFSLCMGMVSFGGWCSVAQTRSMIQGSGLSIFPYIIQKPVSYTHLDVYKRQALLNICSTLAVCE